MSANSLESIANYLEQSLQPQNAKQAESQLRSIELQSGFSVNLLYVIASTNLSPGTRLAAAVFFKNFVKRCWTDEDGNYLLPPDDVNHVKSQILDLMMKLPNQLQVQVGETISIIAESDFPQRWSNLIDDLVSRLSVDNFVGDKGLLIVAHSIFKRWRPLFRSDELFLEIKLVLDKFAVPFLELLKASEQMISKSLKDKASLTLYLDNVLSLMQIYYDLNCQDIPEFFEDNLAIGMEIVHKFLVFQSSLISDGDSDSDVDVLIKIKTAILELISLYVARYADVFEPLIENFIISVWGLINDFVTKQPKFDLLVVRSLSFLTSVAKIPKYQPLFKTEESLRQIVEKIVLPNIEFRETDEEMFEDEPINFVRSDLEGSDFDSRRKAATEFMRELKDINSELLTNIVMEYVNVFISRLDWRSKNLAIYLFSALAAKGTVTNSGVTSTNVLLDVVNFFSENIANYLTKNEGVYPILRSDAIKYILSFRNQLTKDQLAATVPLLIQHLQDENPVVFTYAAITIEKLFAMTDFSTHKIVFLQNDVAPYTKDLLNNLFGLILSHNQSPEKLAENEFLMKCVMRVLLSAEDTIDDTFKVAIAEQILVILKLIMKNPSNPRFSHFCFESLALLIKYGDKDEARIRKYMGLYSPSLFEVLSEDIQEFVPYTFQILAYLLEIYPKPNPLPAGYTDLIKPLMSPSAWEFKGNIPGITRILIAILEQDSSVFTSSSEAILPLLGVFQKLAATKAHEVQGFDLLRTILLNISLTTLQPYLSQIATILLTRLRNSRTERFVKTFVVFIGMLCCIPLSKGATIGLNADFAILFIDSVQEGVFGQILNSLILPSSNTLSNLQDKKVALIGLTQLLICQQLTDGKYHSMQVTLLDQICKNLATYEGINKSSAPLETLVQPNDSDFENVAFGSTYSRLTSIQPKGYDPIPLIHSNDQTAIKLETVSQIRKLTDVNVFHQLNSESQNILKNAGL